MNNLQRRAAALLALGMMGAQAVPAMAAGSNYSTTVGGTKTTTFDKYLVMEEGANVPNAKFSYAVTAGEHKSYSIDGKEMEVLAGITPNLVTMAGVGDGAAANEIAFKQGDTTILAADKGTNDQVKGLEAGEKYVKKVGTLDFSAVVFPEPGIYRYVLTESGTNPGVVNDADATRIVDVYVVDDSTAPATAQAQKKLTILGYVLHSNANDSPVVPSNDNMGSKGSADHGAYDPQDAKSQGFTNDYFTKDLEIKKEVSGNQGSKDKYFEFTVNLSGAVAGTVYDVSLAADSSDYTSDGDADATSGSNSATIAANSGKTNPTSITIGPEGTASAKFYLQHGQKVVIRGLTAGTSYAVSENAEDYKSTPIGTPTGTVTATAATQNPGVADIQTGFTNTRDGAIPTGVLMTVVPGAAVALIGGAGATIMMRKKNDEE